MQYSNEANAIRALAMDAVQQANSGHPGAPMGMAEIATVLWKNHLKHNPLNPNWFNRDRFVLSNGHGSMLLYALLYLSGYDLSLDEIKNFRQLNSKTPGHPENGHTPGVETTSGPLGQGIANAVGMAISEKLLAQEFNQSDYKIIDHITWAFLGDGCLMEGVSHEVCSLAGTLGLGKLIAFWDNNQISIDGNTKGWFTENTPDRFEAYGWQVIRDVDGHDMSAIDKAINEAKADIKKPTLICCKTIIGAGSPKAGTASVHGSPLGKEAIEETRKSIGWPYPAFEMPSEILSFWSAKETGHQHEKLWQDSFELYQAKYPELAKEFQRRMQKQLPENMPALSKELIQNTIEEKATIASRKASQQAITKLAPCFPEFFGGSADLTASNLTNWPDCKWLNSDESGDYLSYGVREFGMSAIMNGMALHGGHLPFGGTFLVFSDYAKNAIRMSALMKQRVIYVFTHDSIGLGEDGPTHQPIEHLASLRAIPNMHTWRPCDTVETMIAWIASVENLGGPSSLCLSRQNLPFIERSPESVNHISKGGYILSEAKNTTKPDAIIIATGSEVELALKTQKALSENENIHVRVVSMPSTTMFDQQNESYRKEVLPFGIPCLAVEAGITMPWYKYVGQTGSIVGLDHFGESAPADVLFKKYHFTVDHLTQEIKYLLKNSI